MLEGWVLSWRHPPWILGNHRGQTAGGELLLGFLAVGVTTEIQINRQLRQHFIVQSKSRNKNPNQPTINDKPSPEKARTKPKSRGRINFLCVKKFENRSLNVVLGMFYIQGIEAASPDLTGLSCSFIPLLI